MGERRHGGPPREEERQRCSCRAATSQAAGCGRSPLPVNQEVSKSGAARRLIAPEASVSAGANTSSFEAQLCNFSFFFPTERNKKKRKKRRLFKATTRSWLLPWIKISWTHSFCFSLIVTNARNVKYIKWNIYIKRFWTSYYRYNLKEKNQPGLKYEARHWRTWMRPVRQRNVTKCFLFRRASHWVPSEGGV